VEIGIAWDQLSQKPFVKYYETGFNNKRMATIKFNVCEKKSVLQYVNIDHPIFYEAWINSGILVGHFIEVSLDEPFYKTTEDRIEEAAEFIEIMKKGREKIKNNFINQDFKNSDGEETFSGEIKKLRKQLFEKYRRIPPTSIPVSSEDNVKVYLKQRDALPDSWEETINIDSSIIKDGRDFENETFFIENLFSYILIHPGYYITNLLRNYCHLGPLREIPPRQFYGVNLLDKSKPIRWENGLAAWDILYWIGQQLSDNSEQSSESKFKKIANKYLEEINDWLSSDQRLNTGYSIEIQHYREIYRNFFSILENSKSLEEMKNNINEMRRFPEKIRIRLKDKARPNLNLTPHEVGVGISQVLPVVVAAIAVTATPLVVIEQPELHIHPAIQVQLGDLFITQSSNKKFFLIETHSEHVLLRIMRRIRETAEEQTPNSVKILPHQLAIYYVESENGNTEVTQIGLDNNGRFTERWPKGFFAERMQEMLPSNIRERVESKRREKL
jgi:hypothetical protein